MQFTHLPFTQPPMPSTPTPHTDYPAIQLGQCQEDADAILAGLKIQKDDICLTLAGSGDNALAMLAQNPAKVIAIDPSPAQLACLELRIAAYRILSHRELLEFMGSRPSSRRTAYYEMARSALQPETQRFWDDKLYAIVKFGLGGVGLAERHMRAFKNRLLPFAHSKATVQALFEPRAEEQRIAFYQQRWNTWRWRLLQNIVLSRSHIHHPVDGRSPEEPKENWIATKTGKIAIADLSTFMAKVFQDQNPDSNPYLHWALTGTHGQALPFALREENFSVIRTNLDRLEWHKTDLHNFLVMQEKKHEPIDKWHLGHTLELMPTEQSVHTLTILKHLSRPGERVMGWNSLPGCHSGPPFIPGLRPLPEQSQQLQKNTKSILFSYPWLGETI